MHLVLVHIGPRFPPYINDCIEQALRIINIHIHIIISREHIKHIKYPIHAEAIEDLPTDSYYQAFENTSHLDPSFRDGFWKYATLRFFYIYAYAQKHNLSDVFHIEYDNLIYHDFTKKIDIFRERDMWLVLDAPDRCIPSFLYFKSPSSIQDLLPTLITCAGRGINDMNALAYYYRNNQTKVGLLPIISNYQDDIPSCYYEHASKFQCLFDGACVGQYIGGVDPRNIPGDTRGFINETTVFKCDKASVNWHIIESLRYPFLNNLPLVNLHIHSKDLKRWSSNV